MDLNVATGQQMDIVEESGTSTMDNEKITTVAEVDIHKDAFLESQDSQVIPGNQEERNMNNKRLKKRY